MLNTLFWILVVIADIWAILNVVKSGESNGTKVLWILGILLFPIAGFGVWYFAGPKPSGG